MKKPKFVQSRKLIKYMPVSTIWHNYKKMMEKKKLGVTPHNEFNHYLRYPPCVSYVYGNSVLVGYLASTASFKYYYDLAIQYDERFAVYPRNKVFYAAYFAPATMKEGVLMMRELNQQKKKVVILAVTQDLVKICEKLGYVNSCLTYNMNYWRWGPVKKYFLHNNIFDKEK